MNSGTNNDITNKYKIRSLKHLSRIFVLQSMKVKTVIIASVANISLSVHCWLQKDSLLKKWRNKERKQNQKSLIKKDMFGNCDQKKKMPSISSPNTIPLVSLSLYIYISQIIWVSYLLFPSFWIRIISICSLAFS